MMFGMIQTIPFYITSSAGFDDFGFPTGERERLMEFEGFVGHMSVDNRNDYHTINQFP